MRIFNNNEYGTLLDCFLCYPCNLQAAKGNAPQQQVDKNLAVIQYNNLCRKLTEAGSKIWFAGLTGSSDQVFTRDAGFIVEDLLFISNMTDPVRQTEINSLKELAGRYGLKTHYMECKAEGGDIMVNKNTVFVGQGNRTGEMSAGEIEYILKKHDKPYEIQRVSYDVSRIHLDCTFNIMDRDTCIISSSVKNPESVSGHFKKVIQIPDENLGELAPNIVQLGNNKHLCSSRNFCSILQDNGYDAIYLDYSEFIKCSGGLGCCVLPLLRE